VVQKKTERFSTTDKSIQYDIASAYYGGVPSPNSAFASRCHRDSSTHLIPVPFLSTV